MLDAIALAGGFRDFAKQKSIYVLRQNPDGSQTRIPFNYKQVVKGQNPAQNIKLQPRDTIVVPVDDETVEKDLCRADSVATRAYLWSQVDTTPAQPADANSADSGSNKPTSNTDQMMTPPPVSGQSYPTSLTAEDGQITALAELSFHQRLHRQRFGLGQRTSGERC